MPTERLFIHGKNKHVLDLMETDKLYLLWGFINSVFWDSPVQAISKEKGSMAKADAWNRKRLLSAMKDGNRIILMVLDAPHGDAHEWLCPLLELAMLGGSIVEEILHATDPAPRRHLAFQNPIDKSVLPPCFISTSPSKKQKKSA
ncbi:hypothetical protein G6F16_000926 [Rhizopus arrhizus]|nr:hypothetical protein G6F23_003323 [Rhizopus arrhizus]KAG0787025.1 hypothetical protein G6F21_008187 [Rhizopus arrhizus]KAG0800853.1 hypothetical protein G6F22_001820 [Rhizopus arrhizus]KAG0809386.1 hypothetical protein G6F20_008819 [Rhizopus arrhizus]KAG0823285.1 hypothetical protein G6F18_011383 [Rhizopus arrhizus]